MPRKTRTDYITASLERLEDSRRLIESNAFGGSIYLSGLAIESLLKAFINRKSEEIKGHNLGSLAVDANVARRLSNDVRARVEAAISEAAPLWRNLFRYSSDDDLDRM